MRKNRFSKFFKIARNIFKRPSKRINIKKVKDLQDIDLLKLSPAELIKLQLEKPKLYKKAIKKLPLNKLKPVPIKNIKPVLKVPKTITKDLPVNVIPTKLSPNLKQAKATLQKLITKEREIKFDIIGENLAKHKQAQGFVETYIESGLIPKRQFSAINSNNIANINDEIRKAENRIRLNYHQKQGKKALIQSIVDQYEQQALEYAENALKGNKLGAYGFALNEIDVFKEDIENLTNIDDKITYINNKIGEEKFFHPKTDFESFVELPILTPDEKKEQEERLKKARGSYDLKRALTNYAKKGVEKGLFSSVDEGVEYYRTVRRVSAQKFNREIRRNNKQNARNSK